MKLMLHELTAAIDCVAGDRLPDAFKMLARVSRIMEQLVGAWSVLAGGGVLDSAPGMPPGAVVVAWLPVQLPVSARSAPCFS